jgi:hypothetical protein
MIRNYLYGSRSFHQQAKRKRLRKTLISTVLRLLQWLFIIEDWSKMYLHKVEAKNLRKKLNFLLTSWKSLKKKSRSGSVSKRHGSGTLMGFTRREIITVWGQSYIPRLTKYWPPTPLSARRVCPPPATKAEGTLGRYTLAGRRGGRGWGVNILEDERNRIAL